MLKILGWLAVAVVVVLIAAYFWLQQEARDLALPPTPPVVEAPAPVPEPAPQIQFPIPPPVVPEPPLPSLGESDPQLREGLLQLVPGPGLLEQALLTDFVRRVVATIDNLPRQKINLSVLPVKSVPGKFLTAIDADGIRLRPENSVRYAAYMRIVESIDVKKLVALYVRFYPLFQQAYQDLGYPKGYFNDRLMFTIDDLLAAPEVKAPLRLVQPKVMYEFADPDLEACSAGQKIMMRIGNANAALIKAKLRAIRAELAKLARPSPG